MLLPLGKGVFVHLRFDGEFLHALGVVQAVHLDLVVEVADVADDGLVFHLRHVFERDDVAVAGRGDVKVGGAERVLDGRDFKTFHRGLQGVDRINFRDDDARAESAQRMRAAFADVAVTADAGDLAGDHHVGRALDAVRERFAAAVKVVELGLGDGVVDVDGGNEKFSLLRAFDTNDERRWWFLRKHLSNPSRLRARNRDVPSRRASKDF